MRWHFYSLVFRVGLFFDSTRLIDYGMSRRARLLGWDWSA